MTRARLGSFIFEHNERNRMNRALPVYSVTNSRGFCQQYFNKVVASEDRSTYKIVPRNYFAYNPSRINVGSIDWQRYEESVIVSPLYVVFNTSDEMDNQFLCYYLKSDVALTYIRNLGQGSVRDNLKFAQLSEIPINVYSLEEQKFIAQRLDALSNLISLRQREAEKLDELVKARFVEMFGDLAAPNCKWETIKIVEACENENDIKCGPFGTQLSKNEYQETGVAVWEIPQINSGFQMVPTHFLTAEKAEALRDYSIVPGDIAMSRKGNVGKCAVFPESLEAGIIHSDVLRIRVNHETVSAIFLMYQLHFSEAVKHQIAIVSSGAIMAGINVTKLKKIRIHIPPLALQTEFAHFVHEVDREKERIQRSAALLETVKRSLMQQYFG